MNIFLIVQLHIDICIHIERMHIILRCMQDKSNSAIN